MEIILNLAWVLFSVGLIGVWWRCRLDNPRPVRMQLFALAMVVLLLLPVISLSDDLLALQGAFETDSPVRRILHENHPHPTAMPAFMAMPQAVLTTVGSRRWIRGFVHPPMPAAIIRLASRSIANRPPPRA